MREAPLTPLEAARKRPGMYVGGTDDNAVLQLVYEVLGNAVDQHLLGRAATVAIAIEDDGTITMTDDGPGLSADGARRVPPLHELLTTLSTRPTVDGHRPHVHIGLGGAGLFIVNALSESFEVSTIHAGIEARARYASGVIVEPVRTAPTALPSGTTIRFRPDRTIFRHAHVPRGTLARRLEDLGFLLPGLAITLRYGVDAAARGGLRGRVALALACALEDVAYHAASFQTERGPLEVEVALAWKDPLWGADGISSFVNLAATSSGSHVDGLLDAVRDLYGPTAERGLTACVSIILADVAWGSPSKERLATPEVRKPVAAAVLAAFGVQGPPS